MSQVKCGHPGKEFQGEIKVAQKNCSDSTSAKVSTDAPDDDSQQGPEHTEARPRADRSSIAGCNDADFEQTAARSPGKMLQNLEPTTDELERELEQESSTRPEAKPHSAEKKELAQNKSVGVQCKTQNKTRNRI